MSPLKDWRYEELREKMVAELPPLRRGEKEDPRIAKLRAALRRGDGSATDTWELELEALEGLLEDELLANRRKHFMEELT